MFIHLTGRAVFSCCVVGVVHVPEVKLHSGPQRASWCWWHSCQLWAECSVSAALGLASNRQEESRAHTHTPYRKKDSSTHLSPAPSGPVSHLLWPDSVSSLCGGWHSHQHEHLCSSQSASDCLEHTHILGITISKHGGEEFSSSLVLTLSLFPLSVFPQPMRRLTISTAVPRAALRW